MKAKQKENPFGVKVLADKPVISIDKSCTRIIEIVITPPDVEEKYREYQGRGLWGL